MASVSSPSPRGRRLSELLEEQQEPFKLDVYLLEKGYSYRTLDSHSPFMCWPGGNRQRRPHIGFRRGGFLRCVLTKLVYGKATRKALNWENKGNGNGRLGVSDCFHQMASKTHGEELHGRPQWSCLDIENLKQRSPVSVLELHSSESSPFHTHTNAVKEEKHSSSSPDSPQTRETSITFDAMFDHSCFSSPTSHYGKTRRKLSYFDHLLLDYIDELKERILDSDQCLDPGVAESFIQEQMLSLWRQRGNERSIAQLVESDFSSSIKEWRLSQHQLREIGIKIEAAIFEDNIEEAILDMLGLGSNCI